jgi:hypothetical protein
MWSGIDLWKRLRRGSFHSAAITRDRISELTKVETKLMKLARRVSPSIRRVEGSIFDATFTFISLPFGSETA